MFYGCFWGGKYIDLRKRAMVSWVKGIDFDGVVRKAEALHWQRRNVSKEIGLYSYYRLK